MQVIMSDSDKKFLTGLYANAARTWAWDDIHVLADLMLDRGREAESEAIRSVALLSKTPHRVIIDDAAEHYNYLWMGFDPGPILPDRLIGQLRSGLAYPQSTLGKGMMSYLIGLEDTLEKMVGVELYRRTTYETSWVYCHSKLIALGLYVKLYLGVHYPELPYQPIWEYRGSKSQDEAS